VKRLVIGLAALLFVASLVLAWLALRAAAPAALSPPPVVPAQAVHALLDAALPDADGKSQAFAQWRGRLLVVNYWATWCTPCRDEMPALARLQTRYGARGVQIIGVAIDDADKVRDFARAHPMNYPLLVADRAGNEQMRALGNQAMGLPYTIVIDRAGQLSAATLGRVHEDALIKLLDAML